MMRNINLFACVAAHQSLEKGWLLLGAFWNKEKIPDNNLWFWILKLPVIIALNMEGVSPLKSTVDLQWGGDTNIHGYHLAHHVWHNHCITVCCSNSHKCDPIPTSSLQNIKVKKWNDWIFINLRFAFHCPVQSHILLINFNWNSEDCWNVCIFLSFLWKLLFNL